MRPGPLPVAARHPTRMRPNHAGSNRSPSATTSTQGQPVAGPDLRLTPAAIDAPIRENTSAGLRARSGRYSSRQINRILSLVIAAAAGVIAAVASSQPTIYPLLDAAFRLAFGFGVTYAAAHARRWSWLVLAGLTAAVSRDLITIVPAWLALTVAFVAVMYDVRWRWVGGIIGLLSTTALLRLTDVGPFGLTALITFVAVVPVFASAYNVQRRRNQRKIRRVVWGIGAVFGLALLGFLIAAVIGAAKVGTGVDEARAGVRSAKAGDEEAARVHLQASGRAFSEGSSAFDAWFAAPARLVPGLSYQAVAVSQMSAIGHDLAVSAEEVSKNANYRSIDVVDGRVDIESITRLATPLESVKAALAKASADDEQIDDDWLLPPLRDKLDELRTEVRDAATETQIAIGAVAAAPELLGATGTKRYFVGFTTPAESRGLGGFMGNYAVLTADNGHLDLTRTGRSNDLYPRPTDPPRHLEAPADYIARYGPMTPERELRDVTLSPDFPSVAQAIESIYPQTRDGEQVDGVIMIDPYALAAMLQITGPINVDGLDKPLTADNAAEILLREQYVDFDSTPDRVDFLEEASRKTFDTFIHAKSLKPTQLAAVFGPVVEQRRLMAQSTDPSVQSLFEDLHLDGAFPVPDGGDFFALVTQNGGNNKIDVYLHRKVTYDVTYNPVNGRISAKATVVLHNDAPRSGLPDYVIANRPQSGQPKGVNWTWFNFYSPHVVSQITLDGEPMLVGAATEFGLNVYQAYLPVPAQGDAVVAVELSGSIQPSETYRLSSYAQPTVNPDDVTASMHVVAPYHVAGREPGDAHVAAAAPGRPLDVAIELVR